MKDWKNLLMNESVELANKFIDELNTLSSYEIVNRLIGVGIKGEIRSSTGCAISEYLKHLTGVNASTISNSVFIYQGENGKKIKTSSGLKEFVENFDNGLYPYLVNNGLKESD